MSIFTKIAEKYDWMIIGEPVCLSGGFMHKMYKINTQQGTFALKLLNPFVMQRETAMDNYVKAERKGLKQSSFVCLLSIIIKYHFIITR